MGKPGPDMPLLNLELRESEHLVGFRFAVRSGNGPAYVSPAMMYLIVTADSKFLDLLMRCIPLKQLPPGCDFTKPIPMVTRPPECQK